MVGRAARRLSAAARGFATGIAAFHVSEVAGIAMGLNGLATAFLVPLLIDWMR